jgi:predicted small metal-binding protein
MLAWEHPGSRGGAVAYTLRCRDGGADCPGEFTTETQEELMKHVQLHIEEAHPEMQGTPVESVQPLVREV